MLYSCSPAVPTLGCASASMHSFLPSRRSWTMPCALRSEMSSSPAKPVTLICPVSSGYRRDTLSSVANLLWCSASCLTSVSALPSKKALHSQKPQPIPWHKTCSVLLQQWRHSSHTKTEKIPLTSTFDPVCGRRAIYKILRQKDTLVVTSHGCMTTKTTYICLLGGDVHSKITLLPVKVLLLPLLLYISPSERESK